MLKRPFRLLLLTMLVTAAGSSACSKQNSNYTGNWKVNCSDRWGVLIKPAEGGRYALTFCGVNDCLAAGTWMSDSTIDGDPTFEVVSAQEIRIKRKDSGYFSYSKCTAESYWQSYPR